MSISETVSAIIDRALSLPYPILIACLGTLAFLLFSSKEVADEIAAYEFRESYRFYLGPLFLLVLFLTLGRVATSIIDVGNAAISRKKKKKVADAKQEQDDANRHATLEKLTAQEKGYLVPFIEEGNAVVKVGYDDGIMQTLCAKGITYLAAKMGSQLEGFDFGIQPWAREMLEQNPRLLEGASGHPRTPREKLWDKF